MPIINPTPPCPLFYFPVLIYIIIFLSYFTLCIICMSCVILAFFTLHNILAVCTCLTFDSSIHFYFRSLVLPSLYITCRSRTGHVAALFPLVDIESVGRATLLFFGSRSFPRPPILLRSFFTSYFSSYYYDMFSYTEVFRLPFSL